MLVSFRRKRLPRRSVLGEFEPDVKKAKRKGVRYKPWLETGRYWMANATLGRPRAKAALAAYKVYREMQELHRDPAGHERLVSLIDGWCSRTRGTIRRVFREPRASIVFEENGTSALALLAHLLTEPGQRILTTNNEGRLIHDALSGIDFFSRPENFKQPIRAFAKKRRKVSGAGKKFGLDVQDIINSNLTDAQLTRTIIAKAKRKKSAVVVVPHVSRTGRILPVREIYKGLQGLAHRPFFIVDGVQAVGRIPLGEMQSPLSFSDAYVFTSGKALEGLMASAIIMRKGILSKSLPRLLRSEFRNEVAHGEFDVRNNELERRIRSLNHAISAPELVSLNVSLEELSNRRSRPQLPMEKHFGVTRRPSLEAIKSTRKRMVKALERISGITVVADGQRSVPSIINIKSGNISTQELKNRLQALKPPITVASIIHESKVLRISLSENAVYSGEAIERIAQKFEDCLAGKRVRKARECDATDVLELIRDTVEGFKESRGGYIPDQIVEKYTKPRFNRAWFTGKLHNSDLYVCTRNGRTVGVSFVSHSINAEGRAELSSTYVHPDFPREKIGTGLVEKCAESAKRRGATGLHFLAVLPAADFFIRRFGAKRVPERDRWVEAKPTREFNQRWEKYGPERRQGKKLDRIYLTIDF